VKHTQLTEAHTVKEETHNTQRHIHTERHRHTERDLILFIQMGNRQG